MVNINQWVGTGNLTKDPELRSTSGGTSVCVLRIACNERRKDATGSWVERANFFDVVVWGVQGENAARYLSKGRGVAIAGRLEWREWRTPEGEYRSAVQVVAHMVQFLPEGRRREDDGGFIAAQSGASGTSVAAPLDAPDLPADDFAGVTGPSDDIPF